MEKPKPYSLEDLISLLERKKEVCEEGVKKCEEALKTLKHPNHIKLWKEERGSFRDCIKEIEGKLTLYRKVVSSVRALKS